MKQLLVIFLVLTTAIANLYSQEHEKCGSSRDLESIRINNPKLYEEIMKLEKFTQDYIKTLDSKSQEQIITIPVVVHVVWKTQTEKINKTVVDSQIEVLNEDYRRQNSDAVNTPTEFQDEAVDTKIEFYLACKDPQGNSTTGITFTETTKDHFYKEGDSVKYSSLGGHDAWPSEDYLNIWVCDLAGTYLGYAQFPGGDEETDGVVIDYQAFGTEPPAEDPYDLGRTTTHEVGHWLNLYHLWGNGGCVSDDYVNDTPMQSGSYYGLCPMHPQTSCNSHDMFMNYMDYTDDACMNLFTEGQKNRMRALFSTGGPRETFADKCLQDLGSLNLYIDGYDLVCSTNKTFELNNLPTNTCADVVWTKSTNLEIVTEETDSYTVKAKSNSYGPGWVNATVSDDCGDEPVVYNIEWVGPPYVNPATIQFQCDEGSGYFCTNAFGNEFSFSYLGPYNYFDVKLTNLAETQTLTQFTIYDTEGTMDYFPAAGTYLFQVRGNNNCGTATNWSKKQVEYVNCGMGGLYMLDIFPNPAAEHATISIVSNDEKKPLSSFKEIEWKLEVYTHSQLLKHSEPVIFGDKFILNTKGWASDLYFIRVFFKDEVLWGMLIKD